MMKRPKARTSVSRRAILSTFAGLSAAGFFKGLLRDAFASDAPPRRFVVLWSPHGCAPELWRPRSADGGSAGTRDWVLDFDPDAALAPLEPHKDSLLIVEGLDLTCNFQDDDFPGHDASRIAVLTGRSPRALDDSYRTTGPSIDHVIAKQLATRPFFFKPTGSALNATSLSFDDAGEAIPYEFDLRESFGDWFHVGPTAERSSARTAADSAILKYLQNDARRLRSRLAAAERAKVDAQLDALHVLEQQLNRPVPADCQAPALSELGPSAEPYLRDVMDFGLRLLSCGLTQCVTLNLDVGQTMPWIGLGDVQMHDDVAHQYRPDDPVRVRQLSKLQCWYSTQVAYFIQGLKSVPEGGGTLYDSTTILWANEFGDPARHQETQLPFIVAGGAGAHQKGRYLQLGTADAYTDPSQPHNALLTSVANSFGLNLPGFGDPRFPAELSGFLG
jgi:hypothetical protein